MRHHQQQHHMHIVSGHRLQNGSLVTLKAVLLLPSTEPAESATSAVQDREDHQWPQLSLMSKQYMQLPCTTLHNSSSGGASSITCYCCCRAGVLAAALLWESMVPFNRSTSKSRVTVHKPEVLLA